MKEDSDGNANFVDNIQLHTRKTKKSFSSSSGNDGVHEDDKKLLVRGRQFDESKPETFNQVKSILK